MTREEARKAAEIMMAYANGEEIEIIVCGNWEELEEPVFNWDHCKYRIKPETKYRPFKNSEECWSEMQKHQPFGWLKNKGRESVILIGNVYMDKEVLIVWAYNQETNRASDLFNDWVFADGTPFGIKEE